MRFTLNRIMIVVMSSAVVCAVASHPIAALLESQREREQNASRSLKTLSTPERDFRSSDRDGGLVHDFWSDEVRALYGLAPAHANGPCWCDRDARLERDPALTIKLLEASVVGTGSGEYQELDVHAPIIVRPCNQR